MKKWLFGRVQKTVETILSPLTGNVLRLEDVPDPIFSRNSTFEGIAIDPSEGWVTSPVNGRITWLFETGHAVCVCGESGLEILIHIGLDTVSMRGDGFRSYVKKGERVKAGQPLIQFSLDLVREKATSTITPVLILGRDRIEHMDLKPPSRAQAGVTTLMKVKLKP